MRGRGNYFPFWGGGNGGDCKGGRNHTVRETLRREGNYLKGGGQALHPEAKKPAFIASESNPENRRSLNAVEGRGQLFGV